MHAKTNRQNHDFQIAYFLVGACHTTDGAYALLCDLRESRDDALKHHESEQLRTKAKRLRAEVKIRSGDEIEALEGQADIADINAGADTLGRCVAAARAELAFINKCIDLIQPLRKFSHLPDIDAHEAVQQDEWLGELLSRAECSLLTSGSIQAEQFLVMRQHPQFKSVIGPAIEHIQGLIKQHGLVRTVELLDRERRARFSFPALLESRQDVSASNKVIAMRQER